LDVIPGHEKEATVAEPPNPQAVADCGTTPAAERRSCGRHGYHRQPLVRYLVRPSFHCGRAFLRDLSHEGLALLVSQPLPPGTVLVVQLRGRRPGGTHIQLARVVHVAPHSPGRWLVGCRLTCPLSDDQLRQNLPPD
jgi:hypothetical protein